jgi:LAO/AO transport system kinase
MSGKPRKSALHVQPGVTPAEPLNPNLGNQLKRTAALNAQHYVAGILGGDLAILSRAITLVESTLPEHQKLAEEVINACLPHSGNSIRIGITGIPGVGKSTFIEAFGLHLIREAQKKVAVLAVDPSSQRTKGSIMGDKTRMEVLSQQKQAFIRPSPSAGSLGGVARKTRETAILCEAAGFDAIIIETVGVGQSETAVKSMVDYFLLLLLPGAGDELQGIKRGIMEMADGIAINKADGDNLKRAQLAAADVKRAIHLFPPDPRGWHVPVDTCSSLENSGIATLWQNIERFERHMVAKGFFAQNREDQAAWWLRETITEALLNQFHHHAAVQARYAELEAAIRAHRVSPFTAARELLALFTS